MEILGLILLFFILCLCWGLTLLGLPGNWLILIVVSGVQYFLGKWEWSPFFILAGLASAGEIVEFAASAAGLTKGGSRRGALFAMLGSLLGSALGIVVGIPIPIVGSFIGAFLFAAIGAMVGAAYGEMQFGKTFRESLEIGKAVFWGRLLGSTAKILFGCIMIFYAIFGFGWSS